MCDTYCFIFGQNICQFLDDRKKNGNIAFYEYKEFHVIYCKSSDALLSILYHLLCGGQKVD